MVTRQMAILVLLVAMSPVRLDGGAKRCPLSVVESGTVPSSSAQDLVHSTIGGRIAARLVYRDADNTLVPIDRAKFWIACRFAENEEPVALERVPVKLDDRGRFSLSLHVRQITESRSRGTLATETVQREIIYLVISAKQCRLATIKYDGTWDTDTIQLECPKRRSPSG
jgi:hypothetical protein